MILEIIAGSKVSRPQRQRPAGATRFHLTPKRETCLPEHRGCFDTRLSAKSKMKVVLFCGGLGMRIRDYSDAIPKPMVPIGGKPILWHVMKYYAHFGHKNFILCGGYKGEIIEEYFVKNNHQSANGKNSATEVNEMADWKITFVDTGSATTIGQRLKAVESYVRGEKVFLANYTDALTNLPFPEYLNHFYKRKKIASFLCVRPSQQFHVVSVKGDVVKEIEYVDRSNTWINGGYFIFRNEFFKFLNEGEELVEAPFQRLIKEEELLAYKYRGFWVAMDTFKEKQRLEDFSASGHAPWEIWRSNDKNASTATN